MRSAEQAAGSCIHIHYVAAWMQRGSWQLLQPGKHAAEQRASLAWNTAAAAAAVAAGQVAAQLLHAVLDE